MRYCFFLLTISSIIFLGCNSKKELQPKLFFIPKQTILLLKIDDQTIAKELLWQTIRSGQWGNIFKKGSDKIVELIQNKDNYGLSKEAPLFFFTYQLNDSTYKSGLIFTIEDSLKLLSSLSFKNNYSTIGNHVGANAHQYFYLYFHSDSSLVVDYTPFTDSLPLWTNQYSITGVLYSFNKCNVLPPTYIGIQSQNNTLNINLSNHINLETSIEEITLPNGWYMHSSLKPILSIDTCFLTKYSPSLNLLFPNKKDQEALFNSDITLHWLGWDTITSKEYQTVVTEEFETILKPIYKSHSYPLLKIQTPNDSLSEILLNWATHQKIIKKQNAQKYMCVLGVQKSFVHIKDSVITYLPEKFPLSSDIQKRVCLSYKPGTLKGIHLQSNPWKQHLIWDQWAAEHITSVAIIQNHTTYQVSIKFISNDFVLLSLLKTLYSAQELFNAHNLEQQ